MYKLIILLLISNTLFAQDNKPEKSKWSGSKGYFGFSSTRGNSNTDNITAGLKLKMESKKWLSTMSLDIIFATSDDIDTAERYVLASTTGYKLDDNDYLFYGSRYEQDKFSAFDYTMTSNVGWGHKFYDKEDNKLITELGIGYKTEAFDIDRRKNTGLALTGKLDYLRKISQTTKFVNTLFFEATSDNTYIQNDIGISVKVSAQLNLNLVHQTKYNSTVPSNFNNTDTLFSLNLAYTF